MHKFKSSSALRLFEFVLWEESEKSRKHPELVLQRSRLCACAVLPLCGLVTVCVCHWLRGLNVKWIHLIDMYKVLFRLLLWYMNCTTWSECACVCLSVCVCVCVWELRLGCCLKWAMGCSAAAAVCMLMLRQSWRTWERRGKGQSTPPQTHIHAQSQPAISHLSWWRIRTGWMCWCVAASLQRIRRIKPTNTD